MTTNILKPIKVTIDTLSHEYVHIKEKIVLNNKNVYSLNIYVKGGKDFIDFEADEGIDSTFLRIKQPSGDIKEVGLTAFTETVTVPPPEVTDPPTPSTTKSVTRYLILDIDDPRELFEGKGKFTANVYLKRSFDGAEIHAKGFVMYTTGVFS